MSPSSHSDPSIVAAMAQLADTCGHASTGLFNYRCDNPDAPDAAQALALEMELDQRAIDLRKTAISLLGAQSDDAIARMNGATQQVNTFLSNVEKTEARLALATAVIALAAAAMSRDAGGVIAAVGNVDSALKTATA